MPTIFETVMAAIAAIILLYIGYLIGKIITTLKWKKKETEIREDAIKKSRAVLSGQFSEQLAPYLPDFPYKPTEVRFLGKPIDFIVFRGLDEKEPEEVVFVEVKSGKSKLSKVERKLRDIIKDKKTRWEKYEVPEELTQG